MAGLGFISDAMAEHTAAAKPATGFMADHEPPAKKSNSPAEHVRTPIAGREGSQRAIERRRVSAIGRGPPSVASRNLLGAASMTGSGGAFAPVPRAAFANLARIAEPILSIL